jgi:hypothetical protein
MFNFGKWKVWLEEKSKTLQSSSFAVSYFGNETSPKSVAGLQFKSERVLGQFSVWSTGEADYDIVSTRGETLCYRWGIQLQDDTVESEFKVFFDTFVERLGS